MGRKVVTEIVEVSLWVIFGLGCCTWVFGSTVRYLGMIEARSAVLSNGISSCR